MTWMNQVARYGRMRARPGKADELAAALLAAAADLEEDPACQLYLINRDARDADTIWVTELWRSAAELEEVRERIRESAGPTAVMALVEDFEMVELDLLGGKQPFSSGGAAS